MFPSSRVWVTRAQPGADRTAERLTAAGHAPVVAPLLEIRRLHVQPDLTGIDALTFTSRNGVSAFVTLSPDRSRPVLAVGDATAQAARDAGFSDVRSANGDIHALAALIRSEAPDLTLLHPRAVQPAGDLAAEVGTAARIRSLPVYEALITDTAAPDDWDMVLIHSPRAAHALADRLSPEASEHRIAAAISPAAAAPLASLGFAEIHIAATPDENALLATLGKREASV